MCITEMNWKINFVVNMNAWKVSRIKAHGDANICSARGYQNSFWMYFTTNQSVNGFFPDNTNDLYFNMKLTFTNSVITFQIGRCSLRTCFFCSWSSSFAGDLKFLLTFNFWIFYDIVNTQSSSHPSKPSSNSLALLCYPIIHYSYSGYRY